MQHALIHQDFAPDPSETVAGRWPKPAAICSYENSRYQTAFWPGREYEDRAERIALRHLLPRSGKRACEIGAGFGRLADEYHGYEQVILLDYSFSLLREASRRLRHDPRFLFVAADLYDLPFADSALDIAITVRVLHHVVDLPRAFAQISRVVRPQGVYVAEFANKRHLKARLRRCLTGQRPDLESLDPLERVRLNFDFHPRYVAEELGASGFDISHTRAVSAFRVAALKRMMPASMLAGLDGLLQRPLAGLDLTPSVFLRSQSAKPGVPTIATGLWRCPTCGSTALENSTQALACTECSQIYPILDGIIDFRAVPGQIHEPVIVGDDGGRPRGQGGYRRPRTLAAHGIVAPGRCLPAPHRILPRMTPSFAGLFRRQRSA